MKKTIIAVACIIAGCTTKAKANTADSVNTFRSVNLQEVVVSVNREQTRKINTPQHVVSVPKSFIDYAKGSRQPTCSAKRDRCSCRRASRAAEALS